MSKSCYTIWEQVDAEPGALHTCYAHKPSPKALAGAIQKAVSRAQHHWRLQLQWLSVKSFVHWSCISAPFLSVSMASLCGLTLYISPTTILKAYSRRTWLTLIFPREGQGNLRGSAIPCRVSSCFIMASCALAKRSAVVCNKGPFFSRSSISLRLIYQQASVFSGISMLVLFRF